MAKFRKAIAFVLTLTLCFSMVQLTALSANGEETHDQVVNAGESLYFERGEDGKLVAQDTQEDDTLVIMEKTVKGTGVENQFDVTLTVKTKDDLEQLPANVPDAAVVLVFDLSNSMDNCAKCGQEKSGSNHQRTSSASCTYESRLQQAKTAAKNFITTFANDTGAQEGNKRLIKIVGFGSNAKSYTTDWVDVNDSTSKDDNINSLKNLIGAGLTDGLQVANGSTNTNNGGTNIEGGLMLARNILRDAKNQGKPLENVSYLYTILLTDGSPTYHMNNDNTTALEYLQGTKGGGDYSTYSDVKDVPDVAKNIREVGGNGTISRLYSICFGKKGETSEYDTKPFGSVNLSTTPVSSKSWGQTTIGDWLGSFSTKAYKAGSVEGLFDAFNSIGTAIQLAAQAYQVKDEMGPHITAQTTEATPSVDLDNEGKNLTWNLRDQDSELGEDGFYTYTYTYRAILDNLHGDENIVYAVNSEATLSVLLSQTVNGVTTWDDELQIKEFPVPTVKAFVGDLEFTKVGPDGTTPLEGASFTLKTDDGKWTASVASAPDGTVSFKNIPSGHTYTLTEEAPKGYNAIKPIKVTVSWGNVTTDPVIKDGKLVDKYIPETTTVTVKKDWWAPEGYTRPDSITAKLVQYDGEGNAVGSLAQEIKITSTTDWTGTFNDVLIRDEDGNTYTYKVEEVNVPEGWTATASKTQNANGSWTIVNTATGKTSLTVTKNWILPNDKTGPDDGTTVNVTILADGVETEHTVTLSQGNGWTATVNDLDAYGQSGQPIEYTVNEQVDNAHKGLYQQVSIDGGTITNTVAQEEIKVSGTKTWKDGGDSVAHDAITVTLCRDGELTDTTATLNDENGWSYMFDQLDKYAFTYDELQRLIGVHEIVYTVVEDSVPEGYKSHVDDYNITNTRTGETSVTVQKEWVIKDGAELPENGIEVTLTGGTMEPQTATLTAEGNWRHTFENLQKYDAEGREIVYKAVEETVPEGYTSTVSGIDENGVITITNTFEGYSENDKVSIPVQKTWHQPGAHTDLTATFTLYADGESTGKTLTITGDGVSMFSDLDKYEEVKTPVQTAGDEINNATTSVDEDGNEIPGETTETGQVPVTEYVTELREIEYSVEETPINGYTTDKTIDENGVYVFTNTISEDITLTINKTWVQPAGDTPEVTFDVKSSLDGENWTVVKTLTLASGAKEVQDTFPKYDNQGQLYIYTIEEKGAEGYSTHIEKGEDGYTFNVTNTINQKYTTIPVTKTWANVDDIANADLPDVTIVLYRNGTAIDRVTLSGEGQEGKAWNYTFTGTDGKGYPVYSEEFQTEYTYTIGEEGVPFGYESTVNGFNVTNTLKKDTVQVTITKFWVAPEGYNLPTITVTLKGTDGSSHEVTLSKENAVEGNPLMWEKTVELPYYGADGRVIRYYAEETPVNGFTTEYAGTYNTIIINTIAQDTTNVSVEKRFVNNYNDQYPVETPDSVTVGLYQNGVQINTAELNAANEWSASFENLDKYNLTTGQAYKYEIFELDANGQKVDANGTVSFDGYQFTASYETAENGHTVITNTYNPQGMYWYRVNAYYTHYDAEDNVTSSGEYHGPVERMLEPGEVNADTGKYASYGDDTYNYLPDHDGTVSSVNVEDKGTIYELELYYELRDPTPDPEPEEPENPDPGPGPGPGPGTNPDPDPQPTPTPTPDPEPDVPPVEIPDDDTPTTDEPDTPPIDIPDDDTPTTDLPDEDTPTTDLPDEDTPTTDLPDEEPPLANIPDDDVPMDEAPKTGDESLMMLWGIVMMMSGLGLTILSATKPRRRGKHCK